MVVDVLQSSTSPQRTVWLPGSKPCAALSRGQPIAANPTGVAEP